MTENTTNWTKEELKVYILIYCANADFTESKFEINYIKSKIETSSFDKIHAEFENDNDYSSIQKIQSSMEQHNYNNEETDSLLAEIKELFLSDSEFDALEQNLFRGLKHILK
ncbi:MAG: hypothetical protein ACI8XB_003358 [Patiriisocius sp.]|jgi:hypothetical protein